MWLSNSAVPYGEVGPLGLKVLQTAAISVTVVANSELPCPLYHGSGGGFLPAIALAMQVWPPVCTCEWDLVSLM